MNTFSTGAFNICCKLLQQGEPVHNCAHSLMEAATLTGESLPLTSEEQWYLERILYDGYFPFEAMTARKCGMMGSAVFVELLLFLRAETAMQRIAPL